MKRRWKNEASKEGRKGGEITVRKGGRRGGWKERRDKDKKRKEKMKDRKREG